MLTLVRVLPIFHSLTSSEQLVIYIYILCRISNSKFVCKWQDANLPNLDNLAHTCRWIYQTVWHMATAMPDLQLPSRMHRAVSTAPWPVLVFIPQRIGGWVGLNVLLHTKIVYLWMITNLSTNWCGLFSRTTWISRHQKGKPFWILLKQEMMGWQWHQLDHMQIICTTLQIDNHTSPVSGVPHHSIFYGPDALPDAQPTVSKHWRFIHNFSIYRNATSVYQQWQSFIFSTRTATVKGDKMLIKTITLRNCTRTKWHQQ